MMIEFPIGAGLYHSAASNRRGLRSLAGPAARAIEGFAPAGEKRGHELVFFSGRHSQTRQGQCDGKGNMVSLRPRGHGSTIGGMRVVDDDGGFNETAEVRISFM